jgi:hypothetical protein
MSLPALRVHPDHERQDHSSYSSDPNSDWRRSGMAPQPRLGLWPSSVLGVILVIVLILLLMGRL